MMSPVHSPAYIHPQLQIAPEPILPVPFPPYQLTMRSSPIPSPEPDALYDTTNHLTYLQEWHSVHPGLQRVVFPIGVYTYIRNEDEARYWHGKEGHVVDFKHHTKDDVRSIGRRGNGRRAGVGSGGGVLFIQ